jgi:hypothetical protein
LEYWSIGGVEEWRSGVLEYWSIGVLEEWIHHNDAKVDF